MLYLSRVHFSAWVPHWLEGALNVAWLWFLLWRLPLFVPLPLLPFPRPKYDLPGGLLCQHGCVHPAVGELHLWLLDDIVHGDSLQRSWVQLGFRFTCIVCGLKEQSSDSYMPKSVCKSQEAPRSMCYSCAIHPVACIADSGGWKTWAFSSQGRS